MSKHPPAARRAVIRELKAGGHPNSLLSVAQAIDDPGHAASALLALAGDPRLPATKSAAAIRDATNRLKKLDRLGRYPEAWGEALALGAKIERGPECVAALERLHRIAMKNVLAMPQGEWTAQAIRAVAPYADDGARRKLMHRALVNKGWELEAGKDLLGLDATLVDLVREHAPPDVASRLLARADDILQALEAAWFTEDRADRMEALRVLIWQVEEQHQLGAVVGSAKDREREDRAAVLTMVAGRMDRLGGDAQQFFDQAEEVVRRLNGDSAIKARRKLTAAMERAGLPAPTFGDTPKQIKEEPVAEVEVEAGTRHVFALVDGYKGGLGSPHLRAVGRAAPLCVAFGLDLALVGFPPMDASQIVELVEADTNIGEGAQYARQLLDAGRLSRVELPHGLPEAWPANPVATTPHPEVERFVALEDVEGPICLLVGLGKQGLPKKILDIVPHHHELTGQGISLETATAMGILADRLGALPQ